MASCSSAVTIRSHTPSSSPSGSSSVNSARYTASSNAVAMPWPKNRSASSNAASPASITCPSVSLTSSMRQQLFERAEINAVQAVDVGDLHVLVQLVDGGVDGAELGDFIADLGDEAAVRRAAAGGERGRHA